MAPQDYAKLKNAELEALLKQRGLQTGGKKADMVARLQSADNESTNDNKEETKNSAAPESAKAEANQKSNAEVPAPAPAMANTTTSEAKTDDAAAAPGTAQGEGAAEKKQTREEREAERVAKRAEDEKKFGQGMNATDIDAEIARRKRRAEKFGVPLTTEAEQGIKALERAKKFGTVASATGEADQTATGEQTNTVGGLDSALPERQRKRGREDGPGLRGGKKQRVGASNTSTVPTKSGGTTWMSEADRAKAEARKAKWGTAS